MIETIVQRLVVLPECGHVLSHLRRTLLLNDDASNEIGNLFHFRFTHAQPGYFYRPHAQASWLIPIFDSVSRNEILVGDNIGLSQSLRHRHPWVFSGAIDAVDGNPAPRDILRGRPHGRIAFANTDLAGASDHRNSIREADRAVTQLLGV